MQHGTRHLAPHYKHAQSLPIITLKNTKLIWTLFFQATSIRCHWSHNSSFSANYRKRVNATLNYSMLFANCNNCNKAVAYTDNVKKQTGYRTCCSDRDSKGLTTDSNCKGSWHWVSQTCFLSIRQTIGTLQSSVSCSMTSLSDTESFYIH